MDRSDLTGRLAKLRAELAGIRAQIVEYRSVKHHSHLGEVGHLERDVRIRQIRAELEAMMKPKRSER